MFPRLRFASICAQLVGAPIAKLLVATYGVRRRVPPIWPSWVFLPRKRQWWRAAPPQQWERPPLARARKGQRVGRARKAAQLPILAKSAARARGRCVAIARSPGLQIAVSRRVSIVCFRHSYNNARCLFDISVCPSPISLTMYTGVSGITLPAGCSLFMAFLYAWRICSFRLVIIALRS